MIWIISAILLGLILGALGYYFSKVALGLFFTIFIVSIFFVPSELTVFHPHTGHVLHTERSIAYLGKKLASLPNYIQWSGLLFVISFFVARVIAWLLARSNILRKVEPDVDHFQRGMEEYSYDYNENDYYA